MRTHNHFERRRTTDLSMGFGQGVAYKNALVASGTGAAQAAAKRQQATLDKASAMADSIYAERNALRPAYDAASASLAPIRTSMLDYVNGGTNGPAAFSVPDVASVTSRIPTVPGATDVGNTVRNAYATINDLNLQDATGQATAAMTAANARRGIVGRSDLEPATMLAMQKWQMEQGSRDKAQGALVGLDAEAKARQEALSSLATEQSMGATLRAEQLQKYLTALQYLTGDTERLRNASDPIPVLNALMGVSAGQGQATQNAQQIAAGNASIWNGILGAAGSALGGR